MRRLVGSVVITLVTGSVALAQTPFEGTSGNDRMIGSEGPDALFGGAGADELDGRGGDDQLDGGPGPDILRGGDGNDVVVYTASAAVRVSVNDLADDGTDREGDLVADDVEAVHSGSGDDTLVGGPGAQILDGGAGDDLLDGAEGADTLYGGDGDDRVDAIDGDADVVDCGPGNDTVNADAQDLVTACETVALSSTRRVAARVRSSWTVDGEGRTSALSLQVSGLSADGLIDVRCRGRGCRDARRVLDPPAKGRKDVAAALRGARLAPGTRIEIRLLEPEAIGVVVRWRMRGRRGPARRDLCLPPNARRPRKC